MPNPRTDARWALAPLLVASLLVSSCDPSPSDPGGVYINVGIQNSSSATLEVTITVNGSQKYTGFHAPGYTSTEVNGTSGDTVGFSVTGGIGTGSCTATNAIVGTSEYGQVNLFLLSSGVFIVECATGWVESGGP